MYLADFSATDRLDMFDILSGEIQFYPGWKIHGGRPIRAPSLKQVSQTSAANAIVSQPKVTIDDIMAEMHVKLGVQKDLRDMMKFITINNITRQEK